MDTDKHRVQDSGFLCFCFRSESKIIRDSCFEVPFWIKWFAISALKSRSESNDLWYALRCPVMSQMIWDSRFEVRSESNDSRFTIWISVLNQIIHNSSFEIPFGTKWYAIHALKSRSESNDSRFTLWSPILNQMIHNSPFEVPFWIKWFTIHALKSRSESNDLRYAIRLEWFKTVNNFAT